MSIDEAIRKAMCIGPLKDMPLTMKKELKAFFENEVMKHCLFRRENLMPHIGEADQILKEFFAVIFKEGAE